MASQIEIIAARLRSAGQATHPFLLFHENGTKAEFGELVGRGQTRRPRPNDDKSCLRWFFLAHRKPLGPGSLRSESTLFAPSLHQHIQDLALLIDKAPEIHPLTRDPLPSQPLITFIRGSGPKAHPHLYCDLAGLAVLFVGFELLSLTQKERRRPGSWHSSSNGGERGRPCQCTPRRAGTADRDLLGRSHFGHRDRFVAGTCQLLGQRLRLLRQSGRQYALCGDLPTTGGGQ